MPVSISGSGEITGTNLNIANQGTVLISKTSWTTATGSVSFVFDLTKYTQYRLTYWITHDTAWNVTGFRFNNSSGVISDSQYYSTSSWLSSASPTSYTTGDSAYSGSNKTYIWCTGNGTGYDSHGQILISVPNTGLNYGAIKCMGTLVRRTGPSDLTYDETSSGHYNGAYSNTLTGCTLFGTGGTSIRGNVMFEGIKL